MAVDTDHLAIHQFALDTSHRDPAAGEHGNVSSLRSNVVEFQDDGVSFTALSAGVRPKVVVEEGSDLAASATTRLT